MNISQKFKNRCISISAWITAKRIDALTKKTIQSLEMCGGIPTVTTVITSQAAQLKASYIHDSILTALIKWIAPSCQAVDATLLDASGLFVRELDRMVSPFATYQPVVPSDVGVVFQLKSRPNILPNEPNVIHYNLELLANAVMLSTMEMGVPDELFDEMVTIIYNTDTLMGAQWLAYQAARNYLMVALHMLRVTIPDPLRLIAPTNKVQDLGQALVVSLSRLADEINTTSHRGKGNVIITTPRGGDILTVCAGTMFQESATTTTDPDADMLRIGAINGVEVYTSDAFDNYENEEPFIVAYSNRTGNAADSGCVIAPCVPFVIAPGEFDQPYKTKFGMFTSAVPEYYRSLVLDTTAYSTVDDCTK